jgi:glycogen debranching enzyme
VPPVAGLERVLSPAGWPLASAAPIDDVDPGRYAALFGRDSLIVSLQVLPARPDLARATLRVLAASQGRQDDPETEEAPGRILHERWERAPKRLVELGWPVRDGGIVYYGSADATSWFLVVLDALGDDALAAELEPAWRSAGRWLHGALEDAGGLVRHGGRHLPGGLAQQGWRDTRDPVGSRDGGGILREDGTAPRAPLADADSQAAALAALRALARLSGSPRDHEAAGALAARIENAFSPETIAIEPDGRAVSGAGSWLGWLLWAGVPEEEYAERLVRPDLLTPWGLRTLSAAHPAFDRHAYHRGSVWPFDSWLGWGGLRAAGFDAEAERVRTGVLAAIDRLGLWPELYAVGAGGPEPIAIANRVQAWTVGAAWALANEWDGRITEAAGCARRRESGWQRGA